MQKEFKLPEVALIAATRGMIGFGAGLLAGPLIKNDRRRIVGTALLAIGALSTIPLAIRLFRRMRANRDEIEPDLQAAEKKQSRRSEPPSVMH